MELYAIPGLGGAVCNKFLGLEELYVTIPGLGAIVCTISGLGGAVWQFAKSDIVDPGHLCLSRIDAEQTTKTRGGGRTPLGVA